MEISNEQKMTIIGLALAIMIGGGIYVYRNFLTPAEPGELLNTPEEVLAEVRPKGMVVHVCGAVAREGVYRLKPGDRILDAIQSAGGKLVNADLSTLNLAEIVKDGEKINVPVKNPPACVKSAAGKPMPGSNGKVNLNTATEAELDELPGVGPATAKKIIELRPFSRIEDLSKIPRFGKAKIDKLKEKVCF
jgi:competence protein ComEA